jgi:hypothetical protein
MNLFVKVLENQISMEVLSIYVLSVYAIISFKTVWRLLDENINVKFLLAFMKFKLHYESGL